MNDYDVVLLHPNISVKLNEKEREKVVYPRFLLMPIGFFSIAYILEKLGFKTQIINLGLEECINRQYNIVNYIKSINSKIFAIGLHWVNHSYHSIKLANVCKKCHPESLIVLGGFTATWFRNEIMKQYPSIDLIVRGEGEESLVEVAKAFISGKDFEKIKSIIYRDNGAIKETQQRRPKLNIDETCSTKLELMKHYKEYLNADSMRYNSRGHINKTFWLLNGRGCIYNCIHCGGGREAYKEFSGREKFSLRDPKNIVEDIQKLIEYGVRVINFSHDPLLGGKKYYLKIFD